MVNDSCRNASVFCYVKPLGTIYFENYIKIPIYFSLFGLAKKTIQKRHIFEVSQIHDHIFSFHLNICSIYILPPLLRHEDSKV